MVSNYSTCRACGQRMLWIITARNKKMPCAPAPVRFDPAGGPETFVTPDGQVVRGRRKAHGDRFGYISHFATCPQADQFRKQTKEGKQ